VQVASCSCGASQSSPAWAKSQAFLGTRSWSKHSPPVQRCTCSNSRVFKPAVYQSLDHSKESSLESLLVAVAEDSGETGTSGVKQEDVVRSPSQEMGASALEKKARGAAGRGTKRLRSALVNGNGSAEYAPKKHDSMPAEYAPKKHVHALKKQANGKLPDTVVVRPDQNGAAVPDSVEPLGGAEQKEAKLGRSFSDATIASMPLKKRKLQLMKAMMEEQAEEPAPAEESPREFQKFAPQENGHKIEMQPESEEGREDVADGLEERQSTRSSEENGNGKYTEGGSPGGYERHGQDLGGFGSVALDVLAGVAASAEVEMMDPILKAPVKGKRNGGRRARFGGERGNSSRENSADEKGGDVLVEEKDGEQGAGIGPEVSERKDEVQKRNTKEEREKDEEDDEIGQEGVRKSDGAGSKVEDVSIEQDDVRQDPGRGVRRAVQEAEQVSNLRQAEQQDAARGAESALKQEVVEGGSLDVPAASEQAEPGHKDVDDKEEDRKLQGSHEAEAKGAEERETKDRAAEERRSGNSLADRVEDAATEDGGAIADEQKMGHLASINVETPEWDGVAEEFAEANLSPVSVEEREDWGGDESKGAEPRTELQVTLERGGKEAETESLAELVRGEVKVNSTTDAEERDQGSRGWSAGSRQGRSEIESRVKEEVREETRPAVKETAPAVKEAAPAVKESGGHWRSDSYGENDLEGDQVDLDYGGSSGEDEAPTSPPEVEAPQTSLAAAVSSAVAAAQGGLESTRESKGGQEGPSPGSGEVQASKSARVLGLDERNPGGLESGRVADSARGSDLGRGLEAGRTSDGGPPPWARRVVDLRRSSSSREGSRERRDDGDRWQDSDRPAPYRREFPIRGVPRGGPDYHPGGWGSAPPYGGAPKGWVPGIPRRGPNLDALRGPPSLNAAAAAAARLQSTGFVVNPDGTISKVPDPMMRGGGMYGAGGLRRIGGPGGVPRAVLAYPGVGGPPGMGGLVGPVTRPVMLVPGRGLVEVPYPGPRPMMGGPPPRYPPGGLLVPGSCGLVDSVLG
jgi:hypothetical protein